ncbi:GlxA family transcriptional regulator [Cribrihabitans pelagius]|uniref:GlxA family transcriptional regulator n=1 Tax=Cribrihabitans pelagius TaxID=1765746 RepID=UPI003B599133
MNRFVFLLMPGFSALELGSGIESLAAANETSGKTLFQWKIVSETGDSVISSSGLTVAVDTGLPDVRREDCIVICSAFNSQNYPKSGKAAAWLRQAARLGARLCALGGGALFLARIGIAKEGRISSHWRMKPIFQESFFELDPVCTIFEETANVVSCGGGAATLDLFSALISQKAGPEASSLVADQLLSASVREGSSRQAVASLRRVEYRNEKLSKAIGYMQECLEDPVSPSIIAKQVGISTRQLERLFSQHLGNSPKSYMTILRLEKARALLQQTQMRVIDVAAACGFSSVSHFSKHYKKQFGITPRFEKAVLAR